jgi:peroxiredoxin
MKFKSIFLMVMITTLVAGRSATLNYGVGDTVSDFKLKNVDGKMVSLSDFKNSKGVIVVFDCNTCPYSKAYKDRIVALNNKYADKGFPVININSNDRESSGESFDDMVEMAKSSGYNFPYLSDDTQSVARSFGATNTPHVFLLKKNEKDFTVAYVGAIDNNPHDGSSANKKYVEDAVNAILAGQSVPNAKTKAVGCGIKWKNV